MKASGRRYSSRPTPARKAIKSIARREAKSVLARATEMKFHHVSVSSTKVTNSGTTNDYLITQFGQLLTDSGRVGDTVNLKRFHVKGILEPPTTAGQNSAMRFVILRSKQRYTAAIASTEWADVFNSTYTSTVQSVNAPRNMDTLKSYSILYDKVFTFKGGSDSSATKPIALDIDLKLNSKLQFEGGSTNYGNGHIYIFAISDNLSATAADQPAMSWVSTIYYTDN